VETLLPSDYLKFYTDGSLFESRASSGILDLKESFALEAFASVFQTEVHAILAGSDYCA
jgi:hypothetical protein